MGVRRLFSRGGQNFPDTQAFGKFPNCLGILEISSHLRNFQNLKNIPPSNICRYLGNFPDTQAFGKFSRYPGICEISQIPLGIWVLYIFKVLEISQIARYLGNWFIFKIISSRSFLLTRCPRVWFLSLV